MQVNLAKNGIEIIKWCFTSFDIVNFTFILNDFDL